jgi:glycosyltransferase involved in cell wall biosynthesis
VLLGGDSPSHPYIRLLQRAEDRAYSSADAVVSILPNTRDYMVSRGLDPRKFVYIPNGVPVSDAHPRDNCDLPHAVEVLAEQERKRGRFLVGYAGGIDITSHAVETLLDAACILAKSGFTFLLAGDGPQARNLQAQVAQFKLDNFHVLGRIPKPSVKTFLSKMDALAIPMRRTPLYRFGVSPNKMFDYMLAGRPILQASGASNDLVAEAGCGLTVPPEDPAAFADAVVRLRQLPLTERQRLGENGRRFVLQNHEYRILARRFLEGVS